jgi:hypothetical protein
MNTRLDIQESDSPILFSEISRSYLLAFDLLWIAEFEGKHPFHWDKSLIFRPISQLLGVALETGVKGLLVCRGTAAPKKHDLEDLLDRLSDPNLEQSMNDGLQSILVPKELYDFNPDKPRDEIDAMYRRHHLHVQLLNNLYDRPFASKYPMLGGFTLPDPIAIRLIVLTIQNALDAEKRRWRPRK